MHISLENGLIAELDRRAGPRGRSAFIARTVAQALEGERRWDEIKASLRSVENSGHEWDLNRRLTGAARRNEGLEAWRCHRHRSAAS